MCIFPNVGYDCSDDGADQEIDGGIISTSRDCPDIAADREL